MFFAIGVIQDRKDLDFHQTMICEICDQFSSFSVFMTYTVLYLFFIPVFKWDKHYYVQTNCCHSLYELDEERGRRIENGENVSIRQEDLTLISKGISSGLKKCSYCGYETDEDFAYCPKCGRPF